MGEVEVSGLRIGYERAGTGPPRAVVGSALPTEAAPAEMVEEVKP